MAPCGASARLCTRELSSGRRVSALNAAGAHDAEVAVVEGRYLVRSEALGEGDDRGVGGAERKVVVLVDQ